jgi:hypothetical protein
VDAEAVWDDAVEPAPLEAEPPLDEQPARASIPTEAAVATPAPTKLLRVMALVESILIVPLLLRGYRTGIKQPSRQASIPSRMIYFSYNIIFMF